MATECNQLRFDFHPLDSREVVARFDGGLGPPPPRYPGRLRLARRRQHRTPGVLAGER